MQVGEARRDKHAGERSIPYTRRSINEDGLYRLAMARLDQSVSVTLAPWPSRKACSLHGTILNGSASSSVLTARYCRLSCSLLLTGSGRSRLHLRCGIHSRERTTRKAGKTEVMIGGTLRSYLRTDHVTTAIDLSNPKSIRPGPSGQRLVVRTLTYWPLYSMVCQCPEAEGNNGLQNSAPTVLTSTVIL